jgi:hypothetical protein
VPICGSSCSKSRFVTNESLANSERKVPAPLVLPFGKLFFGYTYKPFDPSKETKKVEPEDGGGVSRTPHHIPGDLITDDLESF